MGDPKISVLMPAHNAEKYVSEAIESSRTYEKLSFVYLIIYNIIVINNYMDCASSSMLLMMRSSGSSDTHCLKK
jgi:hypothetical protein